LTGARRAGEQLKIQIIVNTRCSGR